MDFSFYEEVCLLQQKRGRVLKLENASSCLNAITSSPKTLSAAAVPRMGMPPLAPEWGRSASHINDGLPPNGGGFRNKILDTDGEEMRGVLR